MGEPGRMRGRTFPLFPTPDLGAVVMLICSDIVFPEAARCLALAGADVVFRPAPGAPRHPPVLGPVAPAGALSQSRYALCIDE
jgi:predicted amidohydrolase